MLLYCLSSLFIASHSLKSMGSHLSFTLMSSQNATSASRSLSPAHHSDSKTEGAHILLIEIIRMTARIPSTQRVLQNLFELLSVRCGLLAMTLEVASEAVTRFYPFGDPAMLSATLSSNGPPDDDMPGDDIHENQPDAHSTGRSHRAAGTEKFVCPLTVSAAPAGKLTFIFPARFPLANGSSGGPATNPGSVAPAAAAEAPVAIDTDFLEAVTVQISSCLALETLQTRVSDAEDKAHQRIAEVATLYEIGQAIDPEQLPRLLQMITDRTAWLMDAQACSLMLIDDASGQLQIKASNGLPDDVRDTVRQIGEGIAWRVVQTEQPMLIVDADQDPRLVGVELRPEIGSSMLVPMKDQASRVMGVLSIRRRRPAADFSNDALKLFSVFATQAGLAIANYRLVDDLSRRAAELLKISTFSRSLISTLNIDELLQTVVDDICSIVGFARCCLYLRDPTRPVFVPRLWRGYPDTIGRNPVRDGEGAVGQAAKLKTPLVYASRQSVGAEQSSPRLNAQLKGFARSLGTRAFVAVPILSSTDTCLGVVIADNKASREPITAEQRSLIGVFIDQAGIAIQNALLMEQTQENVENIRRLKDYTDNVIQSIDAAIVSTDGRGYIARWNRAAEETLLLPHEAFFNNTLISVIAQMRLPASERSHLQDLIRRVQETGERVQRMKLTLHPEARPQMTLNLMLSRLPEHHGERMGIVLIFEDVTQEVRLEAELDKMRRLADIGQLAAKMAHEVRNALSPIKGAAQIIRDGFGTQDNSAEWPDIIIAEVDGLSRLTSEMLDFARPTALDPRLLAINDFLGQSMQTLFAFLADHHVQLQWHLAQNLPIILADPVQLGQVVRNLVMNAAQSMPGGGTIDIQSEYDETAGMLAIHVRDEGNGIAAVDLERIFRPFVTTRTKGTGLGLPIVQKIVDQHGGRVQVDSILGEGTCFTVLLPLRPPPEGAEVGQEDTPLISAKTAGMFPDR